MADLNTALSSIASRFMQDMLEDIVTDLVVQAHKEVKLSDNVCPVCYTRCSRIHFPTHSRPVGHSSRQATPFASDINKLSSTPSGSSTPTGKSDGNTIFECLKCNKQVASNRYAPHLSSCLGMGTARRSAARANNTSNTKSKPSLETSISPFKEINGSIPNDTSHTKMLKVKPQKGTLVGDTDAYKGAGGDGDHKQRILSDDNSIFQKAKRRKTDNGSTETGTMGFNSKVPSKLRESSVNSMFLGSPSIGSRSPSVESQHNVTQTSSASPSSPTSTPLKVQASVLLGRAQASPPDPPKTNPLSAAALRKRAKASNVDYIVDIDDGAEDTSSSDDD